MAATNYTPIQLYYSTTASTAPVAGNLVSGELAINITDGKLYYKDNGGVVQVMATKGTGSIGGATTQIQYNNAGVLAGNSAMTFNSGTSTTALTTLNLTNALGAIYGGTAQSAYAQGDILYSSATNTLSKLGIGTVNYILTSTGTVPQWVAPTSVTVQTANNLAGGLAGSVPYQSAVDTTTFLAIGTINRIMSSTGTAPQWVTALTGLTGVASSQFNNTSLTSGRIVYSGAAGLQSDSANLTFNGTTLSTTGLSNTGFSTLVKTLTLGDSNFNGTAVFAPATPAKLYLGTGTVTDVTSAASATNTTGAIASLAITPIAATNVSVTYTNASTLYIAGAPSAGTNVTITNPYSLYVAAGAAYFGGGISGSTVINDGTANGVAYLNGSKVLTTGAALTFDGTNFGLGTATPTVATGAGIQAKNATFASFRATAGASTGMDFSQDSSGNGYVYNRDSGSVIFGTANAEQMRLTSTGLGIGTSSPAVKLSISDSSATAKLLISGDSSGTSNGIIVTYSGGTTSNPRVKNWIDVYQGVMDGYDSDSVNTVRLHARGNSYINGGNVGIGTSSPVVKLDVNGSINLANGSNLSWGGTYASGKPSIYADATSGYIAFAPTGVTGAERMRLDSAGNLGIGTNTPAAKLDVTNGSVRLSNGFEVGFGATNTTFWLGDSINNWHRWYTSGAEQMRLTSTGLGIGTSSPAYKLDVAGTIRSSGTAATTFNSFISTGTTTGANFVTLENTSGNARFGVEGSVGGVLATDTTAYATVVGAANGPAVQFIAGGSVRATIDSAGNLGLGVTPSAWAASFKAQQIGNVSSIWTASSTTGLSNNFVYDGANKYITTNYATSYEQGSGAHKWYTAPSGTAGNPITFTQAMTLDASGNLGIGTTSPSRRLVVSGGEAQFNNGGDFNINSTASSLNLYGAANVPMIFYTNAIERARIDSSGNLLVGTTSQVNSAKVCFVGDFYNNNGLTLKTTSALGGDQFIGFVTSSNAVIGSINRVTTTNAVNYNTTSDYRLKTVVGAVSNSGARIDALKPIDYTWKENGAQARGFLAHEFQEVYSNSVTGEKDAVDDEGKPKYQAMQASSSEVIADLVAEIQDLRKRLAAAGI